MRATEQGDHLPVEGRDVVRLAAGDQVAVHHHLLVHPLGAGVPRSVLSDGQEVIRRPPPPRPPSASTARGRSPPPACRRRRTPARTPPPPASIRSWSGLITPPGSRSASKSSGRPVEGHVDGELVAPVGDVPALDLASWARRSRSSLRPRPAPCAAPPSPTCSNPSVTRIATLRPLSRASRPCHAPPGLVVRA